MDNLRKLESRIDFFAKQQVNIYGTDAELHFKPFNVLKIIYDNGKEVMWNDNEKGFAAVSDEIINEESYLLKLLCYKRIIQEEIEGGLDTRL